MKKGAFINGSPKMAFLLDQKVTFQKDSQKDKQRDRQRKKQKYIRKDRQKDRQQKYMPRLVLT